MRILHDSPGYRPYIGGIEVFLAGLAPALAERGHEVCVLTAHGAMDLPDSEVIDGVRVERLRYSEGLVASDPRQILGAIRRAADVRRDFAPDVVNLHFSDATIFFYARSAAAHPAPMAMTFHVSPPRVLEDKRGAMWESLGGAARVTACSQATLDDVLALMPEKREAASVLYNGVEPPPGQPGPPSFDPPVVATAGRLIREKGFDVLVAAMPALRERVPGARLRIAGDGPELDPLRAQVERLGLGDCVELPGWVAPDEIHTLFEGASLVAVPSRWREPFCIVALQAMLAARAVVASDVGGVPEVVAAGETGELVPMEDPGALAAAIAARLAEPAETARMGERGRERALARFTMERSVNEFERLYEGMLA